MPLRGTERTIMVLHVRNGWKRPSVIQCYTDAILHGPRLKLRQNALQTLVDDLTLPIEIANVAAPQKLSKVWLDAAMLYNVCMTSTVRVLPFLFQRLPVSIFSLTILG